MQIELRLEQSNQRLIEVFRRFELRKEARIAAKIEHQKYIKYRHDVKPFYQKMQEEFKRLEEVRYSR